MQAKVEEIIRKVSSGFGGTVVTFVEEKKGVVKIKIFVPSCGPVVEKDLVIETLEDEFSKKVPGFKKLVEVK